MINLALSIPTRVEWEHVQSTGGMKLGVAFKTNDVWHVPIACEATGKFITRPPDGVTSFPVYYSGATVWIQDDTILMFLKLKGNEEGYTHGRLSDITLPKRIMNGNHDVYYVDKDSSRHFVQSVSLLEPVSIVGAGDIVLPAPKSKKGRPTR